MRSNYVIFLTITCFLSQAPNDERLKPFYIPEIDHHNWERKLHYAAIVWLVLNFFLKEQKKISDVF